MALVLDGSAGISGVDGTASNPAIEGTDSNTGIFYPAADTVAIGTGGTERLRVDSAGNAGLGVTPSAWGSGYSAIDLNNRSAIVGTSGGVTNVVANAYFNGTSWIYKASDGAGRYQQDSGLHKWFNAPSGTAGNAITFTQAMTLDASGDLGIGNNGPNARLEVRVTSDSNSEIARFGRINAALTDDAYLSIYASPTDNSVTLRSTGSTAGSFIFQSATNERMRITSGGEVYIAGTTDQGAYNLQVNGTGVWGAGAYVNGSDERIKDNIAPLDSGLDVVSKLNPVTYKYKEDWSKDQSTQTGFIAQELLTALDGKNYVDGVVQQGGEYMSVAYQNIIPILTKAIQEQQAMIDELKAKVAALENA